VTSPARRRNWQRRRRSTIAGSPGGEAVKVASFTVRADVHQRARWKQAAEAEGFPLGRRMGRARARRLSEGVSPGGPADPSCMAPGPRSCRPGGRGRGQASDFLSPPSTPSEATWRVGSRPPPSLLFLVHLPGRHIVALRTNVRRSPASWRPSSFRASSRSSHRVERHARARVTPATPTRRRSCRTVRSDSEKEAGE